MTDLIEVSRVLEQDLSMGMVAESIADLEKRLSSLAIGLQRQFPLVSADTRMFRARKMDRKPQMLDDVGAPPKGSSLGRLNGEGERVLYLSDSPNTAFAEARSKTGDFFCLSEWRVNVPTLALANGGLPPTTLADNSLIENTAEHPVAALTERDEQILSLFRRIFTLPVKDERSLYRWSVACGMVNGFSHLYERTSSEVINGNTQWRGRYPFKGIAYPSVRTSSAAINYALNDIGMSHVRLDHVQWVRRHENGSFTSIDFSNSWDHAGVIKWESRPARFQLRKKGDAARLVKIAENTWTYETTDGSIPWFV